jgi:hypothetical protein
VVEKGPATAAAAAGAEALEKKLAPKPAAPAPAAKPAAPASAAKPAAPRPAPKPVAPAPAPARKIQVEAEPWRDAEELTPDSVVPSPGPAQKVRVSTEPPQKVRVSTEPAADVEGLAPESVTEPAWRRQAVATPNAKPTPAPVRASTSSSAGRPGIGRPQVAPPEAAPAVPQQAEAAPAKPAPKATEPSESASPTTASPSPDVEGLVPELPPGVRSSKLRRRGMELVSQLPEADRERISQALRKLPAEEAGRILSEVGRLNDVAALEEALAVRRKAALATAPLEGPAKPTGGLDDSAPAHLDENELQQFEKRPPPRVSETVEGVSRSALKRRMIRDGLAPKWAENAGDWNPHHLIPVSEEHHPVLETLRAHGGWDNNASRNGFALPTRPDIPDAQRLPVHQVTPKVSRKAGMSVPDPQTMRDLRGHPVWNQKVRIRLDALEPLMNQPDKLRTKVMELIDELRHDIETSVANGKPVLF